MFTSEILDAFDDLWTKYFCESSSVSTATDSNTSDRTEDNEEREEDRFSDDLKSDDMDERMRNGDSKIGRVVTEWSETDTYSDGDLQTERQRRRHRRHRKQKTQERCGFEVCCLYRIRMDYTGMFHVKTAADIHHRTYHLSTR